MFGVELHHLVEKEGSATPVPLLIQKTVAEIERRGLKVSVQVCCDKDAAASPSADYVSVCVSGGRSLQALWLCCGEEGAQGLVRKEQLSSLSV